MAITITWADGVVAPVVFTLSDDLLAAFEFRRSTLKTQDPVTGSVVDMYPTLFSYVAGMFSQRLVAPDLAVLPPTSVVTAKASLDTAQASYAAAQAAAVQAAVTVTEG